MCDRAIVKQRQFRRKKSSKILQILKKSRFLLQKGKSSFSNLLFRAAAAAPVWEIWRWTVSLRKMKWLKHKQPFFCMGHSRTRVTFFGLENEFASLVYFSSFKPALKKHRFKNATPASKIMNVYAYWPTIYVVKRIFESATFGVNTIF